MDDKKKIKVLYVLIVVLGLWALFIVFYLWDIITQLVKMVNFLLEPKTSCIYTNTSIECFNPEIGKYVFPKQ